MNGNVNELCWDRFDKAQYASYNGSVTDPSGPSNRKNREKLIRGGDSRDNFKGFYICDRDTPGVGASWIGFRVVRTKTK